jgi:hypothetical protein
MRTAGHGRKPSVARSALRGEVSGRHTEAGNLRPRPHKAVPNPTVGEVRLLAPPLKHVANHGSGRHPRPTPWRFAYG